MNYILKVDGIRLINKMLNKKIRDFYSYNKIIKKELNIKTNIPIYIDKFNVFLPIKTYKAYDCVWINYYSISDIIDNFNQTIIKFKNGEVKTFNIKLNKLNRIIKNALVIINYFIENVNN